MKLLPKTAGTAGDFSLKLPKATPATDKLLARPAKPAEQLPPRGRSRLVTVALISVAAHVGMLAALATVRVATKVLADEPLAILGSVHILSAEDDRTNNDEPGLGEPEATAEIGPTLVEMNRDLPAVTDVVTTPLPPVRDVIAVDGALVPSGVAFAATRVAATDTRTFVGRRGGSGHGRAGVARLYSPRPAYPSQARENGWEGVALLRIEVSVDGTVGEVEIVQSSGHDVLDAAAVESVRRWKFVPLTLDGVPVVTRVEQAINFKLNRG